MSTVIDKICCRMVRMWLVPRAEGDPVPLPSFALLLINSHIERCKLCKREISHLRLTTLKLRRASNTSRRGSLDPAFAQRVLDRVRREEAARSIINVNRRIAIAIATGAFVLICGLTMLSMFNPLQAEWLNYSLPLKKAHHTRVRVQPPFPEHDPFQPPSLAVTAELDRPDLDNLAVERPSFRYLAMKAAFATHSIKTRTVRFKEGVRPRQSTPLLLSPVDTKAVGANLVSE